MSIDIAISFDEFNVILDYFKSSEYSFINEDLKISKLKQ